MADNAEPEYTGESQSWFTPPLPEHINCRCSITSINPYWLFAIVWRLELYIGDTDPVLRVR